VNNDVPYRLSLALLCLLGLGIRIYYHRLPGRTARAVSYREGSLSVAFQRTCGLAGMALVIVYLVHPPWLSWAALPVPGWLRWLGAAGGTVGLLLLWWTHRALGTNFAPVLHVTQDQTLVTAGPYRWVRHPMYGAMYLITGSIFLLSGVWLIGILYWGSLTLVLVTRVGREEALMTETFGDEYRAYALRTGRFLPRLFTPKGDTKP
jgi:protein-S-isoprenylcysteine O-methyltransferase Ste14